MNKKPNILFITSDQHHWTTMGYNNPEVNTPNLDRIAKEGVIFDRAYCSNPTCTPSRASMITGKYPSQHGAWTLGTKLPENEHTVGEDFSKAGYKTALVGKAHFQPLKGNDKYTSLESYPILHDLKYWKKFYGPYYGFDHVELARNHTTESHVGQHYAIWVEEKGLKNWRDYFQKPVGRLDDKDYVDPKWKIPEDVHQDAWIAERCNTLLEGYRKNGESFFLWASFFDPHAPYKVSEPWDTMYNPDELTVPSLVKGEHKNNPPHFKLTQEENPDVSAWRESGFNNHGISSHVDAYQDRKKIASAIYGMVSLMDKYIGKILDKLDELGLTRNTLVVFTTDHGDFFGQHGLMKKGAFHYEDLLKLPMVARFPEKMPAGKRCDALQSVVDLAPTFLSFCGIEVPQSMTGKNQKDVWLGTLERARDHVIVENHHEPTVTHVKTYVGKKHKITVYYNRSYGEIFDLEKDPGEVNNLWDDPNAKELKTELLLKMVHAELGKEPMWMPRLANA
jgi:uncharacterized sulfatase